MRGIDDGLAACRALPTAPHAVDADDQCLFDMAVSHVLGSVLRVACSAGPVESGPHPRGRRNIKTEMRRRRHSASPVRRGLPELVHYPRRCASFVNGDTWRLFSTLESNRLRAHHTSGRVECVVRRAALDVGRSRPGRPVHLSALRVLNNVSVHLCRSLSLFSLSQSITRQRFVMLLHKSSDLGRARSIFPTFLRMETAQMGAGLCPEGVNTCTPQIACN